jgi:hypothetical protein
MKAIVKEVVMFLSPGRLQRTEEKVAVREPGLDKF